jgi:eukaryotic-like serine/threonine-protein kinase
VLVAREEHGVFHPYVSDFGLAKPMDAAETHTDTGTAAGPGTIAYGRIVGTASYMSPEQAAGHRATTLSDVYGLGAIMYALLTGRAPFRGDTAGDTLALVRDARRPVRPTQLNSRTDRTLESICMMCLRKNPDERYRSAEGLARDLDRWLAHRPTDARRLGMPARARLWCRRNPVGAGLVAALVALTLLSGFELADRLSAPRRARLVVAEQTAALLVSRLTDIKRAVEATAARRDLSGPTPRRH